MAADIPGPVCRACGWWPPMAREVRYRGGITTTRPMTSGERWLALWGHVTQVAEVEAADLLNGAAELRPHMEIEAVRRRVRTGA